MAEEPLVEVVLLLQREAEEVAQPQRAVEEAVLPQPVAEQPQPVAEQPQRTHRLHLHP